MQKSTIIRIMEDAVLKAGRALARDFGELEKLQVSKKGPRDFVTSADLRSEKILIEELQKSRPDYGFLIEESGEVKGSDEEYRWIVDPLDGTNNFMHGIPHFSISLALEKTISPTKKEIVAAVVFAPALNEIFLAEDGQGAYLNSYRISVSGRNKLNDALFAMYPWDSKGEACQEGLNSLFGKAANMRILGSAALELAYVAAGKFDAFWHNDLNPWDMAAGILLVREARGMVREISGGSKMMESGSILATNGLLDDDINSFISKCYS